jgi:3-hydroxypropanoate dehydrogenase
MTAPATVIVPYDLKFYEWLPRLFPQNPGMAKLFQDNPDMVETTALANHISAAIRNSLPKGT